MIKKVSIIVLLLGLQNMTFLDNSPTLEEKEPLKKSKTTKDFEEKVKASLLIRFKENVSKSEIETFEAKHKQKLELISNELKIYKIKLSKEIKIDNAIKLFSKESIVKYVEKDGIMKIQKKAGFGLGVNNEKK